MDLISFHQAFAEAQEQFSNGLWGGIHLLLGNGFSIGAARSFSYDSLHAVATQLPDYGVVRHRFDQFQTTNFEIVLAGLLSEMKNAGPILGATASRDYWTVRRLLGQTVLLCHPHGIAQIGFQQTKVAREFIYQFHKVFTTNYDLVLYWTQFDEQRKPQTPFNDGFYNQHHEPGSFLSFTGKTFGEQIMFNLHGALHLREAIGDVSSDTIKVTKKDKTVLTVEERGVLFDSREPSLLDICMATYPTQLPLLVTEGNSNAKYSRIQSNRYLRWCYDQFRHIIGSLFIYGWSMSEQDMHLIDAISQNEGLSTLYVGIHGSPDDEMNQQLIKAALSTQRNGNKPTGPSQISFFSSASARVWDS